MTTTTNIHRVVSVKVERIQFDSFHSLNFTLTTAEGSIISFDAFSTEPLELQDSAVRRVTQSEVEA